MTRHRYRHYGLTLEVNQALQGVAPAGSQTSDITIEVLEPGRLAGSEHEWEMPDPSVAIWRAPGEGGGWLRLRYALDDEWVEFIVDDAGAALWLSRSETVRLEEATELLLGPVFSCVLRQRGLTCIHAAVVRLDNRLIALVGDSGAGKSTTALALVQEGAALVSDDIAVLTKTDRRITVACGAPRIRMRADSAGLLLGSFDSLQPTWLEERPIKPKRYVPVSPAAVVADGAASGLDVLYFLAPWDEALTETSFEPVAPTHALPRLMTTRHMVQASDPVADRRDFQVLARLAETVRARELLRPASVNTIRQTAAAIVSDVRGLN